MGLEFHDMVFLSMLGGTLYFGMYHSADSGAKAINQRISYEADGLTKAIKDSSKPKMYRQDVIGNDTPEEFYMINGTKVFHSIDGKPVGEFVNSLLQNEKTSGSYK